MFTESSFRVTQRFFTNKIFTILAVSGSSANQCDWIYVLLHNWNLEKGGKVKIW